MPAYVIAPAERDPQRMVTAIRQTQQGRVDCTGMITLTTGSATTIVQAPTAGAGAGQYGSKAYLQAASAAAAAEAVSGNLWVANPVSASGQFTIHHTNSATAGRTFAWVVLG